MLTKINSAVIVSSLREVLFIQKSEIMFMSAHGRYTMIHLQNTKKHIASKSIGEYEKLLIEDNFFRIHHSHIVNINFLSKIIKRDGYIVELNDGTLLNISRRKQEDLMVFLNSK
jgi:two-component system LytT family response regulator